VVRLPERLLVVVAHPDDEVLGCGATIAEVNARGGDVMVLVLSEGSSTQYPGRLELIAQKRAEAEQALADLGGASLRVFDLPDMRMIHSAPADVARPVGDAITEFHPEWLITHHAGDLNSDHRVVHEAARVAARLRSTDAPSLLSMEVPSSTEFGYHELRPNLYVPLAAASLDAKCAALGRYSTEARPFPHGRSAEAVRALAAYRGFTSGSPMAEAFRLIWTHAG
jgi:LmbE family N-acetylglucosaminyl deacetylase